MILKEDKEAIVPTSRKFWLNLSEEEKEAFYGGCEGIEDFKIEVDNTRRLVYEFAIMLSPDKEKEIRAILPIVWAEYAFIGTNHVDHNPFESSDACVNKKHIPTLCLNMNDIFCPAASSAESVSIEKWIEVGQIYQNFGYDGLVVWACIQRKEQPAHYIFDSCTYFITKILVEDWLKSK